MRAIKTYLLLIVIACSSIANGQGTYLDYSLTSPICTSATGKIEITNIKTSPPPFSFSIDGTNFRSGLTFDSLIGGFYAITIKDGFGFTEIEYVQLDTVQQNPRMELTVQNPTCEFSGGSIEIANVLNGVAPFKFFFNGDETTDQVFNDLGAGFYQIRIIDSLGCEKEQGAELVDQCIIPSEGFSPNADGINDVWTITRIEQFPEAEIAVFNRYGQRVFNSTGYAEPWDGTSLGMNLPIGPYYYEIKLNDPSGESQLYTGSVAIVK